MSATLDAYFEALVPPAQLLVGMTRDRADATEVRALLDQVRAAPAPPGVDPVEALAVVLACMVPDYSTPRQLLAWALRPALAVVKEAL